MNVIHVMPSPEKAPQKPLPANPAEVVQICRLQYASMSAFLAHQLCGYSDKDPILLATLTKAIELGMKVAQFRCAQLAVNVSREWASGHATTCHDCKRTAEELGADLEHQILKGEGAA